LFNSKLSGQKLGFNTPLNEQNGLKMIVEIDRHLNWQSKLRMDIIKILSYYKFSIKPGRTSSNNHVSC